MIYKHLNFQNDGSGKAKLFKSLAHSLRISPTEKNKIKPTKNLEWDENLAHTNLIYSPEIGARPISLNSLTEDQKVKIQNGFFEKINDEQKSKDKNSDTLDTLRKYKAKINKWQKSIIDDSDPLKIFLTKSLEEVKSFDVPNEIGSLSQFEFPRQKQKTDTYQKFLELHNTIIENKSDISRNKIFIQEAFFKIPLHNGVKVTNVDLISNIHSFYKKNFPDYPIKLIVFHGDEIGEHPHIFVDAKNMRTGKYDLLTAQKKFVNDNIDKLKDEYPDAKTLDFSKRNYLVKKQQAQYFQTLFYQHSNKMLGNNYGVEAKKLEKTKENNARMRLIEEDAKKPKIEREFSFYNSEMLRLKNEYETAQNNASQALEEEKAINEILTKANADLQSARKEFTDAQEETRILNEDLPKLRSEKQTLTKTNNGLKVENEKLQAKNDGLLPLAKDYDLVENALNEIVPKYERIQSDYTAIIQGAQKQILKGVRDFLSVMWGLKAWSEGKLSFGIINKNKMKGAPEDLQEFDERTEKIVRIATDEVIDTFLDLDFLVPEESIPQAFKSKVKELRDDPARMERKMYVAKDFNLKEVPENLAKKSNATAPNDSKAQKYFDDFDEEEKLKETINRLKGKPKA